MWGWGKEKPESPRKKLQFEGNDVYRGADRFSPLFASKGNYGQAMQGPNNNNPYSLYSNEPKKNYDNIFVNNGNMQNKPLLTLNNFKPGGSIFGGNTGISSQPTFAQPSTFNMNNNQIGNNDINNYQGNFKVIKAEEYMKNACYEISPLNRTKEEQISLDDVNPSLAKYINRVSNFDNTVKKVEEKKDMSVKAEEAKNVNIFEELVPKRLTFNEKKTEEKKEDVKVHNESFNSFAKPEALQKESLNKKPELQFLINNIKSEVLDNNTTKKRNTSF